MALLGSMLELGQESAILHRRSLEEALSLPIDLMVVTGLFADAARDLEAEAVGGNPICASDLDEARDLLLQRLKGGEVVLLKASRGVALERLIRSLEARFGPVEVS